MNMEIFSLINNLAGKNTAFDSIMIFFSNDVPYIFMAIVALTFILGFIKKNTEYRKVSVSTIVFTAINLGLSFVIGGIYYVDRPFVYNKVNLLIPHTADASFPSDHATGTMSIALGFGKYNRAFGIIMMMISVIVGFSRVYVGHHYPADVIGAYIMVFATNYVYNLMLRRRVEKLYEAIEKKVVKKCNCI